MNLSTRFVSDISEILEQIISNKIDSQLATKCKKMNHYLRYVVGDSYQYYMYGSPEDDSAARTVGPAQSSEKGVPAQKTLSSLKHELPDEAEGKFTHTRRSTNGRPKSKDSPQELECLDNPDSRVESAERSDLDFDPGQRRTATRSRTLVKHAENTKDRDRERDRETSTSKEAATASNKKDKAFAPAARDLREREPRDYAEPKDLPLRESSLKDRPEHKPEHKAEHKPEHKPEHALPAQPKDKAPASDEPKGTRHCFKVKYNVDNEFIQALAACDMDNVQLHTLPYFNTKSPHNTVKFRVERGGDRLCKIYNLAFQQSDQELLLDVVESFQRPCAKKKWLGAELPFIDEQLRLMRARLAAAGLSVFAHKVKTEALDDEQATQTQRSPLTKPNEPINTDDADDKPDKLVKDKDRDECERESADSPKEASCSHAPESQPDPDPTPGRNWFGREFYEHVRAMNLNDQRLPFSTIAKNKSSMQCRIKRASFKLEKKFHYLNQSSFYDQVHAYFSKFFLKAVEKDCIQTDAGEQQAMVEWLQRMDRQQREHNEQQDLDFSGSQSQPNDDAMADDHYERFKLANEDGL